MISIHRHKWQRLLGYSKHEWRCTTAENMIQLEHTPCARDCQEDHSHYHEHGCLGTLVLWNVKSGIYHFYAPGTHRIEYTEKPIEMIVDYAYLEKMRTLSACTRTLNHEAA